jgi:hypothetical protein
MHSAYVATAGLETAPLQDGAVLYDLKSSKFIMLNRSAASIWGELSTPRTEDHLIEHVCTTFPGVATSQARQGVSQVLKDLTALELVAAERDAGAVDAASTAPQGNRKAGDGERFAYEPPSVRGLDEEELLNIFQMTAAEISVASCWWGGCPSGCP